METRNGRARERLRYIIERQRQEIERRWLERVERDVASTHGVSLTQLRDGMPDYLVELAHTLREHPRDPFDQRAESAWSRVAREHGITRVRIGFDIGQLVHEFVVLRRVITDVALEQDPTLIEAEGLLAELLDAAIGTAVQAYVDARDYEARRDQAASIGFLTHELRHPLSAAMLAAERLRRGRDDGRTSALDTLDRALHKLGMLIDSVLLTEKLEAGEVEVEPSEIRLRDLMEPIESLRAAAERKGLRFQADYDPALSVTIDPDLTRSALQNLVENAVKYTDAGGVAISVADEGDELIVDIRDTCKGLSPEELATIFEPFKRGRSEKTGTGLGLAIARRAIEAQGGRVEAESPGPSGCHFFVRVPKFVEARASGGPRAGTAQGAPSIQQ
jgi:signal transduction histidine kinase